MKNLTACLAVIIALAGSVFAQDADEKKEPVIVSQALKLGEEGLTEYTGLSEAGQDQAAELYAAAKPITTEQALGQKNLQLVIDLDGWRTVVAQCRRSCMSMGFITNNGGTMSGHQARRDSVAVKDFLSEMSKTLPLQEWPNVDKSRAPPSPATVQAGRMRYVRINTIEALLEECSGH